MPKDQRARKFALRLRMVNAKAVEEAKKDKKAEQKKREAAKAAREDPESNLLEVKHKEKPNTAMFFSFNTSLGPPYQVLIDTNFISFAIQRKIDIIEGLMDSLYAKCIPLITDCVMGLFTKTTKRPTKSKKATAQEPSITTKQASWRSWARSTVFPCASRATRGSSGSRARTRARMPMTALWSA